MSPVTSRIPAEHQLRVTTLNINHAPDELERRTGLACDELSALLPAVLCLQEVRFEVDGGSFQLDTIAAETGLAVVSARAQHPTRDGALSGNAILSHLPAIEAGSIVLGTPDCQLTRADYAVLEATTGQTLIVVSAHLAWGGDQEGTRLIQMTAIDNRVRTLMGRYQDQNPVAILAGDFNTLPTSDTNRYLNGQGTGANDGYTFWTEAFAVVGNPEEAATVAAGNYWAQQTARSVGIEFPEMLPDRRIDYVWTYGWAYGRPGCPVAMQRSFTDTTRYGYPASDHYGLTVDFWMPPVLAQVPAVLASASDDSLIGRLLLLEEAKMPA
ncbi:Endonuclease/exonuclease/phosphatase (plasmid) [Pseudarthrobacter chlorophenolicus A6]|uniref:Endonuclease/exonuclease/phosphatase n=1 Tax=Pseudarthrobacter chlorophenolicus (strain ATCC 700700 / DSM 12829 / CIP 107037 / JCM 12360 / KCTC 9906 / NCIMB 13794 / A6) TaxID=452863 RepID=B8HHX9_PSECP|nr:endonuclease/exonuclease/phosphatase family protein [Pseudarthrobacter chlorophenolicus]ACL42026.1 Endonuclease/exonuclease/phosphatase [Pseudarthrobacter chlorophenolicus A6]SDQ20507.1 Metal-dependent hydrolase, endonuclease/exonuclease/phosphatase family [Pseudarthrobacter chlorophenolicus]